MVDVGTEVANNVLGWDHSGAYTRPELGIGCCVLTAFVPFADRRVDHGRGSVLEHTEYY